MSYRDGVVSRACGVRMTWQPIETAPRDGTRVLILLPCVGYGAPRGVARAVFIASYDSDDGWCVDAYCDGPFAPTPTHWQPLPTTEVP